MNSNLWLLFSAQNSKFVAFIRKVFGEASLLKVLI